MSQLLALQIFSASSHYSLCITLIYLVLGSIGNLLNVITFLNLKIFRQNPCTFYLTVESLLNTWQLLCLSIIRLSIWLNNNFDPANQSSLWCKSRTLMSQPFALMGFTIVCLAAHDQCLSTSYDFRIRQLSSYSSAKKWLLTSTCIWLLHSIPLGFFLDIRPFIGCTIVERNYALYNSFFFYPILLGFLPMSIASIFSFIAYRNVRRICRRQVRFVRRQLDRQLTAMILIRVMAFVTFLTPFLIHRIYWLQLDFPQLTLLRSAIEQLVLTLVVSILNLNFGASFYIFILSSKQYRRQVKRVLMKKMFRLCIGFFQPTLNQVHPAAGTSTVSSDIF